MTTNTNTTAANHSHTIATTANGEDEDKPQTRFSTVTNQSELSFIVTATHSTTNNTESLYRDETIQSMASDTSYARPSITTTSGLSLRDIDDSSVSLCSIDLGGGLVEEFHNTFKN